MLIKRLSLTLVLILMLSSLTACSPKASLAKTDFSDLVEQSGYSIVDGSERFDTQEVTASMQAVEPEEKFTIEYYEFSSSEQARSAFDELKKDIDAHIGISTTVESNLSNYNIYRVTKNNTYYALSRIENTLVYVATEDDNKDVVDEILKTLGYK